MLLWRGACFQSQIMLIVSCIMQACTQYFTFGFCCCLFIKYPVYVQLCKRHKYKRKTTAHDIKAANYDHWDLFYPTILTMHVSIPAWLKMQLTEPLKVRQYGTATVCCIVFLCLALGALNKPVRTKVLCIMKGGIFPPTAVCQSLTYLTFQEHNRTKYLCSFYKSSMSVYYRLQAT